MALSPILKKDCTPPGIFCGIPGGDRKPQKGTLDLKQNKKKIALIALGVVLALLLALFGAGWMYYHSKVSLLQYSDGKLSSEGTIDDSDSDVLAESAAMEEATSGLEEREIVEAEGEIFGTENVFNILLIGSDERSAEFSENARGDTCMLLSINKDTMAVKLVSFERGMGVPILAGSYQGQYDWLTHTFRYGGADLMMQEIRECFKIDVTHYVRVNIYTFMKLVDCVGGVDIDLTEAEANYINHPEGTYAAGHIREMGVADQIQTVTAGVNHLNGATAMLYARCRYIDNDWHRVERQRNVIQAAVNQTKNLSILELNTLLDEVLPLIQTNLTESEITSLMLLAPRYQGVTMDQMTIPAEGTYGSMTGMGGRSMFAADFNENARILREFIYGEQ